MVDFKRKPPVVTPVIPVTPYNVPAHMADLGQILAGIGQAFKHQNQEMLKQAQEFTKKYPPQYEEVLPCKGGDITVGFWHTDFGVAFAEKTGGIYNQYDITLISHVMLKAMAKAVKLPKTKLGSEK